MKASEIKAHWRRRIEEEFAGFIKASYPDGVGEGQLHDLRCAFLGGLFMREILELDFDKLAGGDPLKGLKCSDLLDATAKLMVQETAGDGFIRAGIVDPKGGPSQ